MHLLHSESVWQLQLIRQAQKAYQDYSAQLLQILQIYGRNLTAAEDRYANSWLDMGMEEDAIAMAYERTCLNTGGLNWNYMNKILTRWYEAGFKTAEDIRLGDRKDGNKTAPRQLDEDEKAAIARMLQEV